MHARLCVMLVCGSLSLVAAVASSVAGESMALAQNSSADDKSAFLTARRATEANTWKAALMRLKRIDTTKIEDDDVLWYVDYCIRCATLADTLGVDRNSDPNNPSIDWEKFVTAIVSKATNSSLLDAAKLLLAARDVQKDVDKFIKLDKALTEKYGVSDSPKEAPAK